MTIKSANMAYAKAVDELASALASHPSTRLEQAGCIQYFEFSFELAWKAIKVAAERQGMDEVASPRGCLKAAFAQGWINDEAIWLEMLESRNAMAHTYDSDSALRTYDRLVAFLPALGSLVHVLEAVAKD